MSEYPDPDVALLAKLIGFHTENPGGDELPLCRFLADQLNSRGADTVDVVPVNKPGRAGGYVFARFGTPRAIINVHLDTVPANNGWTRDPFVAEVTNDRIYGLGSADTKGAIAATLRALESVRPKDFGILFSGDEENGTSCIDAFMRSPLRQGIERAWVCEPTGRRAGTHHRGVLAYRAQVHGQGGHSSKADTMDKPIVTMARLAVALDQIGRSYLDVGPEGMKGVCMNVAGIDGGVAFNVVPDSASLTFCVRPPPGFDIAHFESEVKNAAATLDPAIEIAAQIRHPTFSCPNTDYFRGIAGDMVSEFAGLDFWTEAAFFAGAGIDAVVIGPGDIAQAHTADEFLLIDDLRWGVELFARVLKAHEA